MRGSEVAMTTGAKDSDGQDGRTVDELAYEMRHWFDIRMIPPRDVDRLSILGIWCVVSLMAD